MRILCFLPLLSVWPKVQLKSKRRAWLGVQMPVGIRNLDE